jgi:hypothetical protein
MFVLNRIASPGSADVSSAGWTVGRNAASRRDASAPRKEKIARGQHVIVIGAVVRAADTAQYEPELRNKTKGRFEERDVGLGIDA